MLNLSEFVRANKKVAIWVTFFVLLFLVRKVFGLVFLTFILCYIFNNAVVWLESHVHLKRYYWAVVVYLLFVSVVTGLLFMAMPRIITEAREFFNQLPESMNTLRRYLDELAQAQPQMAPFLDSVKEAISLKRLLGMSNEGLVGLVFGFFNRISHFLTYFLLATLFSFLIVFDLPKLKSRVLALRQTRFKDVYDETADSVAQFAMVVGYTFQAQILIAILNTILTASGLWLLGIGQIALLSSIVFFAGLIPVWGTFISSIPILLLAFNDGGIALAGKTIFMIAFVHIVEAYILNPNIVSAVLKINPLLTLIILYVGHTLFGLWGLLLGVPVAVYVYRYIIMKPMDDPCMPAEQTPRGMDGDQANNLMPKKEWMMPNNALETLKEAILIERRGHAFYLQVANLSSHTAVREFFETMAEEEMKHAQILEEQYKHVASGGGFSRFDAGPAGIRPLADVVLTPDVKERIAVADFEAAAISAAVLMEERAIAVYGARAAETTDTPEKALFEWLVRWEQAHLSFLATLDRAIKERIWNDQQFWPF